LAVMTGAIPVVVLLNLPPAIGMMIAGFLAVLFYRRRLVATGVSVGVGARLGVLCGLLASGALAVSIAIAATVFHQGARMHQGLIELMKQSMARMGNAPPPEVIELLKTPPGVVMIGIFFVVMTLVFSALGGVLGAALLGKKDKG